MKVLCFFVCLFSFNLYANSVLENLWEQCRENSVNIKLNKVMENQAEENLKKLKEREQELRGKIEEKKAEIINARSEL